MTTSRCDLARGALIGALAVLAGCQQAPESGNAATPVPSTTPAATGVMALPEAEQRKLAFRAAYGEGDTAQVEAGEADTVTIKPGKLVWIGETAALLSSGPSQSDCHACSGALAIAYLKPKGDGFEVTGSWPALVRGSGWGQEPEWKLRDDLTSNPAIYVEAGWTGQGYSCGSASITELKPDGPVQSDRIGLSASNGGAIDESTGKTFGGEPAKELTGQIVDIVKDKSFAVKATGTASFVEKYEYRGGKFVALQETRLTC